MLNLFVRSSLHKEVNFILCQLCDVRLTRIQYRRTISSIKTKPEKRDILGNNNLKISIPQHIVCKIKYNSIISQPAHKSWRQKKLAEAEDRRALLSDSRIDVPLSLKYVTESDDEFKTRHEPIIFPFSDARNTDTFIHFEDRDASSDVSDKNFENNYYDQLKNWMDDYEQFSGGSEPGRHDFGQQQLSYGTPDSSVPVSDVPCGGCGAYLHCQDTAIPGYLPSELFKPCTEAELRSIKCQRCHFLDNYNIALNLNVQPDAYSLLLQHIKRRRALCVVVVDITDYPCSLWPGIMDIIGPKRPVVVVGNKVDLLPSDSRDFLLHTKQWLEQGVSQSELAAARVKHVGLVSAKTGFGIEQLISKLQFIWKPDGDVYLLGCTNAGKSTLFNALVHSDYCKVQAVDLMQRATTSQWPGTTLSLLKFPIQRSKPHLLFERAQRLRTYRMQQQAQEELRRDQLKMSRNPLDATFIGHIAFTQRDTTNMTAANDVFSMKVSAAVQVKPNLGLDPEEELYCDSKWCYDTPGVVHPDQVLQLLTAEELLLTLPRHMLIPRTFLLLPGDTLLVAGLGRLDFLHQDKPGRTRFTVFAAAALPITVCRTEHVDEVYSALAEVNALRVPSGHKERLALWPSLMAHPEALDMQGVHKNESAADVLLSSAGWVAVTPEKEKRCCLRAWTPDARGVRLRTPPLVRFAVMLRGPLIRKTPAYHTGRAVRI